MSNGGVITCLFCRTKYALDYFVQNGGCGCPKSMEKGGELILKKAEVGSVLSPMEALGLMLSAFDNPIARKRDSSQFAVKAREAARATYNLMKER